MNNLNITAEELFDKIRSQFENIKLANENGKITITPLEARFFEFKHPQNGDVVINIVDEGKLKVYFSDSKIDELSEEQQDEWYGFLKEMSKFAVRNQLDYEVKNINKERLDKKDFLYLKNKDDDVMESKLYGSRQKSYQNIDNAKMIVVHNKSVDEDKMGGRSRDIKSVYIENADGERYKFPNTYLPGARAMTRHISNGGIPTDPIGLHVTETMQEMQELRKFVTKIKKHDYVTEDQTNIIESATARYYGLKDTLESISKQKGYKNYFDNWEPNSIEVDENDINDLKSKLTRTVYDEKLTDSLTSVSRALKFKTENDAMDDDNIEPEIRKADGKLDFDAMAARTQASKDADSEEDNIRIAADKEIIDDALAGGALEYYSNPAEKADMIDSIKINDANNLPAEKKLISKITLVTNFLGNNLVDDKLGIAISRLDNSSKKDFSYMIKIASKFFKDGQELSPKTKKDLYGKPKESIDTFESSMDRIVEGTWDIPDTMEKVTKLKELLSSELKFGNEGDHAISEVGAFIGDDELFDALASQGEKDPEEDARAVIVDWLVDNIDLIEVNVEDPKEIIGVINDIVAGVTNNSGTAGDFDQKYFSNAQEADVPENVHEDKESCEDCIRATLKKEGGAAGLDAIEKACKDAGHEEDVVKVMAGMEDVKKHEEGDYILENIEEDFDDDHRDYPSQVHNDTNKDAVMDILKKYPQDAKKMVQAGDVYAIYGTPLYNEIEEYMATESGIYMGGSDVDPINVINDMLDGFSLLDLPDNAFEDAEAISDLQKIREMAGIGSGKKSNFGINPGEDGYQITPRSLIARDRLRLNAISESK